MTEFDLYMNQKNYIEGIGYFYQPKIKDIISLGEEYYYSLIRPFSYTLDIIDKEFLAENPKFNKTFDMFFLRYPDGKYYLFDEKNNKSLLELIIEALHLLTRQQVYLHENFRAIIIKYEDYETLIHRDNFDVVADYILKINNISKIQVEELPKFQNDRQRDIYMTMVQGRRRNAEAKSLGLAEIIKYVRHAGKSIIPFEEIYNMHIYQLYEDNIIISNQDNYEKEFDKYIAGSDPKDLDLNTHWIYKVKNKQ